MRFNDAKMWNLAIDTSCRIGSVSVGKADELLETVQLTDPMQNKGRRRNSVELMPVIEGLAEKHGFGPVEVGEMYVAVGPGSFTGLRISIATAKMFGQIHGTKMVAVGGIEVVARQAEQAARQAGADMLAVCLNIKRGSAYTGLYDLSGDEIKSAGEAQLMTLDEVVTEGEGRLAIVGDKLPEDDFGGAIRLDESLAQSSSETVWQLGQVLAEQGDYVGHLELSPLYVRPPEAVELWDKRHGVGK